MKVNVPIELTDPERQLLAKTLDGTRHHRTRLASRKEVAAICQGVIRGALDDSPRASPSIQEPPAPRCSPFRSAPQGDWTPSGGLVIPAEARAPATQYCEAKGFRDHGSEWHAYVQGWMRKPAAR